MTRPLSDDEIVELLKATDTVPEPSPLFWAHAARRVREALDLEPAPTPTWRRGLAWTAGAMVATALAALLLVVRAPGPPAGVDVQPSVGGEVAALDEASWTFVASLGGDMDVEAAERAGLVATGETTDRAVQALDADERAELASLLHRALAEPEI